MQGYDVDRAKRVLDDAGWAVGADGIRSKNGARLAFTLLDPDVTQAKLAPMSVSIQAQLKLQQTQDYGG